MNNRRATLAIMLASAVWLALPGAPAQAHAAEVTGVLQGVSGDERYPIPGAELTFCGRAAATLCFNTITNSRGHFRFADIPPGAYQVTTESRTGGISGGTVVVPPEGADNLSIVAP